MAEPTSRIPRFYQLTMAQRRDLLRDRLDLTEADLAVLDTGGIQPVTADQVVENAIGVYGLPLGLGLNFLVNGREVLVPMAVDEPSVIAAASNAARMVREGGGFVAEADDPVMTAQIEIVGIDDPDAARARAGARAGARARDRIAGRRRRARRHRRGVALRRGRSLPRRHPQQGDH